MDYNDGVIFRENVELIALHYKTLLDVNKIGQLPKFPQSPCEYYKTSQVQSFARTFGSITIGQTPLWVLAYALSFVNIIKNYIITPNVPLIELPTACDNAYLIDGFLNVNAKPHQIAAINKYLPADPVVQIKRSR